MSEDIDIEEHDLLDNPGLRSVFPDLSIVKQEAPDYDEEEQIPPDLTNIQNCLVSVDITHVSGEKPDSTTDLIVENQRESPAESPLVTSSQSLLGQAEPSEHEERCFHAKVYLENWGGFLKNSECYCSDCKILFATENAIAAHKMAEHSYLTMVSTSEEKKGEIINCDQCSSTFTRTDTFNRHKRLYHNKGNAAKPKAEVQMKEQQIIPHLCQLCFTTFPTKEELIKHLYKHVGHRCDFCSAVFQEKSLLETHLWTHARSRMNIVSKETKEREVPEKPIPKPALVKKENLQPMIEKLKKRKKPPTEAMREIDLNFSLMFAEDSLDPSFARKSKTERYKCLICSQSFNIPFRLAKHVYIMHKQRLRSMPKESRIALPSSICELCQEDCGTVTNVNVHVRTKHFSYTCNGCKVQNIGMMSHRKHTLSCKLSRGMKKKGQAAKSGDQKEATAVAVTKKSAPPKPPPNMKVQYLYKCCICDKSFKNYISGYKHRINRHPEEDSNVIYRDTQKMILKRNPVIPATPPELMLVDSLLQCSDCKCCFTTMRNLTAHMDTCPNRNFSILKCEKCPLVFSKKSILEFHYKQHERVNQIKALDFNYYVKNKVKLLFYCADCKVGYTSLGCLKKHYAESLEKCDVCKKKVPSRVASVHSKHHKDEIFTMKFCHITKDVADSALAFDSSQMEIDSPQKRSITADYSPPKKKQKLSESISSSPNKQRTSDVLSRPKVSSDEKSGKSQSSKTLIECNICWTMMHRIHKIHSAKTNRFVCSQCGLMFTRKAIATHLRQHAISKTPLTMHDFVVLSSDTGKPIEITVQKTMSRLFSCICGTRSHKLKYVTHNRHQCVEEKVRCKICKLDFVPKTYQWHLNFHKKPIKTEDTLTKLPKIWQLYNRCITCKMHILEYSMFRHRALDCSGIMPQICLICGMTLTKGGYTLHQKIHQKSAKKLKMEDFTILCSKTGKPVHRELCPYPECGRCGVRTAGNRDKHVCTQFIGCDICELTFSETAYKLHFSYYGCGPKKIIKTEMENVAEMMDKYNKLDQLWTQLYQCEQCEVIVDSYDEVLKHSEEHREHSYEVAAFVCHVCDLNFDYSSFERHKEQHFSRPGLDRARFEVMEFKPSVYKTVFWQLYQNAFTGSNLQLNLKQPGPEQHTLYQCVVCQQMCDNRVSAYAHTRSVTACKMPGMDCRSCGLVIESTCQRSHTSLHNLYDLNASSFRIFWFCCQKTEQTVDPPSPLKTQKTKGSAPKVPTPKAVNQKAQTNKVPIARASTPKAAPAKTQTPKALTPKVTARKSSSKPPVKECPKLYKCVECNLHFDCAVKANSHIENHNSEKVSTTKCNTCGLNFAGISVTEHKLQHHKHSEYKLEDFDVVKVFPKKPRLKNAESPTVKEKPTLYRCKECDIHFLNEESCVQHVDYKNCSKERVMCAHCKLGFKRSTYSQHLIAHHKQNSYTAEDFLIIDVERKSEKSKLYKCSSCEIHFVKKVDIEKHFVLSRKTNYDECDVCHLKIGFDSLGAHKSRDHSTEHSNIEIETRQRKDFFCSDEESKVFKCTECGNCFLNYGTSLRHAYTDHVTIPTYIPCECGLSFSPRSLQQHVHLHHGAASKQYRIVNIKLQEKHPKAKITERFLYQCTDCDISFHNRDHADLHRVSHKSYSKDELAQCEVCCYYFHEDTVKYHQSLHSLLGSDKEFVVVPLNTFKDDYENVEYLEDATSDNATEAQPGNTVDKH